MSSWILNTVTSQLPGLIEKYEPKIESSLRETLSKLKTSNPKETELFYANWKKLNRVVDETLAGTPVPAVTETSTDMPESTDIKGGKRTRRNRRKQRKHRK